MRAVQLGVVRAVPTITYSMLGRREGEGRTAGCDEGCANYNLFYARKEGR